jgi:hypothetical protein
MGRHRDFDPLRPPSAANRTHLLESCMYGFATLSTIVNIVDVVRGWFY